MTDMPPSPHLRCSAARVGADVWWVAVTGEIDLSTAEEVVRQVEVARGLPGLRQVIVDLTHTRFLDAHGVGALVRVERDLEAIGLRLKLIGAAGLVERVLGLSGLGHRPEDPTDRLEVPPGSPPPRADRRPANRHPAQPQPGRQSSQA